MTNITLPITWETLGIIAALAFFALGLTLFVRAQTGTARNNLGLPKLLSAAEKAGIPRSATIAALALWSLLFITLTAALLLTVLVMMTVILGGDGTLDRGTILSVAGFTTVLGGLVALPLTIIRTRFSARQTRATEEGLITERFNAAVENIGAVRYVREPKFNETDFAGTKETTEPNIEVRVGGLLSLERLARDNVDTDPKLHVQVIEVLATYLRENAPINTAQVSELDDWLDTNKPLEFPEDRPNVPSIDAWADALGEPRTDLQTAITIIGRRTVTQRKAEKKENGAEFKLNLRKVNFQRFDLGGLDLSSSNLFGSRFDGAYLNRSDFSNSNLAGTRFFGAHGFYARFDQADLNSALFVGGAWDEATFLNTKFRRTLFHGCQLLGIHIKFPAHDRPISAGNYCFLIDCSLQSAYLSGSGFDRSTYIEYPSSGGTGSEHKIHGLAFRDLKLDHRFNGNIHLEATFGDASAVTLEPINRPSHWADDRLSDEQFQTEWEAWKKSLGLHTSSHNVHVRQHLNVCIPCASRVHQ